MRQCDATCRTDKTTLPRPIPPAADTGDGRKGGGEIAADRRGSKGEFSGHVSKTPVESKFVRTSPCQTRRSPSPLIVFFVKF